MKRTDRSKKTKVNCTLVVTALKNHSVHILVAMDSIQKNKSKKDTVKTIGKRNGTNQKYFGNSTSIGGTLINKIHLTNVIIQQALLGTEKPDKLSK